MVIMNHTYLTITQAIEGLKKKDFTSVELTEMYLKRIKAVEPKVNAFVTITEEEALNQAKEADKKRTQGLNAPLLGVPISVKDNFSTKGIRTTASSKVLDEYIPPFDATVISRLKDAGMVMLGKTNLDAWAHGSSTETSDYGASRNPWNTEYLPGGSSGGAAASIAADEAVAAIGSETAGSIRQPASWCGVVGLKPTYGRVSRYGVVAMGSSLDSPGPITKTVEDSALLLQILAGQDPHDATTSPSAVPNYLAAMKKDIKGLKIGISEDYFEGVNDEVRAQVEQELKVFEQLGARIKKIKLFSPKYAIAVYTIIMRSEVSSNLARYDGIRYGQDRSYFAEEAKRRVMLGTYALSAGYYDQYYNKALKVRSVIIEDFKKAFQDVDVIIAPTSPTTSQKIGASADNPMFGELSDVLVEPSSLAGITGINVPCGFDKQGLPIGLQIMGSQFAEEILLNAAYKYEQATNWHERRQNI